jgi:hypothetical protein
MRAAGGEAAQADGSERRQAAAGLAGEIPIQGSGARFDAREASTRRAQDGGSI